MHATNTSTASCLLMTQLFTLAVLTSVYSLRPITEQYSWPGEMDWTTHMSIHLCKTKCMLVTTRQNDAYAASHSNA